METNLGRNEVLESISSKFEKKMFLEGFDHLRQFFPYIFSNIEHFQSLILRSSFTDMLQIKIYGSSGEGIVYPLAVSCKRDIDIVIVFKKCVAVENEQGIPNDSGNTRFLIENVNGRPSYCYLRLLEESPLSLINRLFTEKISGQKYLSSLLVKNVQNHLMTKTNVPSHVFDVIPDCFGDIDSGQIYQTGPATSFPFKSINIESFYDFFFFQKMDIVPVIQCLQWPLCASEWAVRERKFGWPSVEVIEHVVKQGIYFAPVGCKETPHEGIQWRYSFNEAERELVRSFNPTQAKCYALLKRIISENVTNRFNIDVISSYHLKTLMFWTIEETEPNLWVAENLIQCIFTVLRRLAQCLEENNCKSYFIQGENLFMGKITQENRKEVHDAVLSIIKEDWPVLKRLRNIEIDRDFINSLLLAEEVKNYKPIRILTENVKIPKIFRSVVQGVLVRYSLFRTNSCRISEVEKIDSNFHDIIRILLKVYDDQDIETKKLVINVLASIISSYGTHFLSVSRSQYVELSDRNAMEKMGEIFLQLACERDRLDCLAKHANYAYMRGNLKSTLSTAIILLTKYANLTMEPFCYGVSVNVQASHLSNIIMNALEKYKKQNALDMSDVAKFVSMVKSFISNREVIFLQNEIYAIPGNAKIEMFLFESKSNPSQQSSQFRPCLVVDPYIYVTYLAFLVYSESDVGCTNKADTALQLMDLICKKLPNSHLPSSLNLLADCYLKKGQVDKAMRTFALSMTRNSKRNAAPWHVARLVWRKLLDTWLET